MEDSLHEYEAKKQKISETECGGENSDIISDLPESVLYHILSFLPTKYVVSTSILSRRWRYVWTSITNLDFDDDLFCNPEELNLPMTKFMNFVDNVLILRDMSCIEKFCLQCGYECDASRINNWIRAAIRRKVRKLDLFFYPENPFDLPCSLFTCESLSVLKLKLDRFVLKLPISIRFPRLKTMHLDSVIFSDDDRTHQLFSNCPILECLIIERCGCFDLEILSISAPALKSLTIDSSPFEIDIDECLSKCKIKVSTPSLVSLKYVDFVAQDYLPEKLSSLVDASVDFRADCDDWSREHVHRACKLLSVLSNARVLSLSDLSIGLLSSAQDLLDRLPTFYNLIHLKLGSCDENGHARAITCLLQSSPNLEFLEIEFYEWEDMPDDQEYLESEKLPSNCPLNCLKVVEIRGFDGNNVELELVKYLLQNGGVLKMLIIVFSKPFSEDLGQQMAISQKLLMLLRYSKTCVIMLKKAI